MALDAYAGNFALNTSTGNQSVTGVGFQPKVVIFLPTDNTADGVSAHAHIGFGAAISSSSRWAVTANDEDAQGTTDSSKEQTAALCILHDTPGTSNPDYEADFVSLDADGFTINITNEPASAKRVGYLALGGSDLTNVDVGNFAASNTTGDQAVTGIGFQPDALLFVNINVTAVPGSAADAVISTGFAISSTERGLTAIASDHNLATSDTSRLQRTDACIISTIGSGAIAGEADFVSMDADGFTINWSNADAVAIFYIALQGGQYAVGTLNSQTGTGNFSETGVGFQPTAGIFQSFLNAASGSLVAGLKISAGIATSSTERFVRGAVSEDAQGTSDTDSFQDDGLIYQNYDFAQSVDGAMDFVSWDADGFTLDQTDADPSANEVIYMVFGSEPGVGFPWPSKNRHPSTNVSLRL